MGLFLRLWMWHHVGGGLDLQHIKSCKLHFRPGDTVSKHCEATFRWITRSLWCGGLKGWRVLVGPLHTHSVNTTLQPVFPLAGGSREWRPFPSLSSNSFNSLVVHPGPPRPGDNQLVFSPSPGYVRGVNICWEHLSNVDRTGVWRHFSRSGSQGCGCWPCLQCGAVKGLFLPVLSNVSHDFTMTVGQCAGRDWNWFKVVRSKIIKINTNNNWTAKV